MPNYEDFTITIEDDDFEVFDLEEDFEIVLPEESTYTLTFSTIGIDGRDGANGIFSEIASTAEVEAGVNNTKGMTPYLVKWAIDFFRALSPVRSPRTVVAPVAGVVTIDWSLANTILCNLTDNVTSVVFTNPPSSGTDQRVVLYLLQDATGGRTVTGWPTEVRWAGGTAPTITVTANKADSVVFDTFDGGVTYFAALSAQNY